MDVPEPGRGLGGFRRGLTGPPHPHTPPCRPVPVAATRRCPCVGDVLGVRQLAAAVPGSGY